MPEIEADPWGLTKVLMNLVGNAVAFAAPDRSPVIEIDCIDDGDDFWQVTVSDNGIGIPEADRPRLFRRFERGSNTGGVSGTGLGLHIVKEIVLGHGGNVWVESVAGVGSKFRIALPYEPEMPPHSSVADVE